MPRRSSGRGGHCSCWKVCALTITTTVVLLAGNGWGNSPLFDYDFGQDVAWRPARRASTEPEAPLEAVAVLQEAAPGAQPVIAVPAPAASAEGMEPVTQATSAADSSPAAEEQVQKEAAVDPIAKEPSPPTEPPAVQSTEPQWIFCAGQWQDCWCGGRVRWGNDGKWKTVELPSGRSEHQVRCSVDVLGDPAWGDGNKRCECEVVPGTDFAKSVNPGLLPAGSAKLFTSCDMFEAEASKGQWGAKQWEATQAFCDPNWDKEKSGRRAFSNKVMRHLMNSWVDPRFQEVHDRYFAKTGWTAKAFLNYYAGPPSGKHAAMTEHLIWSVHEFSQQPIIVFHFGLATPKHWNANKYPQLVLIHSSPMPGTSGRSFNFNKLRAMLLSKALVGIQLDSDQFVAPNVDDMFKPTEREITKDYPMPILPAHFLDRSPRDLGAYWARYCPKNNCKHQSVRWGHAHPTWTYWAVPWIGRWLRMNFRDETLPVRKDGSMQALRVVNVPEDEDLLNIGTWEDGGTKQWCKLDLPGPGDFEALLRSKAGGGCRAGCGDITSDRRWHPNAVAKAFYTAHHAVEPKETARYIKALKAKQQAGDLPPPIMYKGNFYKDGDALRAAFPDITCII